MYSKIRLFYICFLFFSFCTVGFAANKKDKIINELQILIDVSGSMKKNDPKNLRIPAVKLLINLLPEGSKAGIWLFSENTKQLVKTGIVNKKWKRSALLKVNKIHSRGLFTHIEDAIQSATKEWVSSGGQQNRNLILLTDGMVDVSKDIMQSAESRARIMEEQIPVLQEAGVRVQAIALSSEADAELLNKLAFDTGGWSETALSADQLQKVFFKLFKQAVPQDSVPLVGNTFAIDKSIKEFSILIFKKTGAKLPVLISPKKKKFESKTKHRNLAWVSGKSYDLVTIKKPKAGVWKIIATMDPDNQVMIVTDLKFELDDIPNHLLANEKLDVVGFFTNNSKLISRQDFLSLINISVQIGAAKKLEVPAVSGKQGLFSLSLENQLKPGKQVLKIVADGKTFVRELNQTIEVIESLIEVNKKIKLKEREVEIELIPNSTALNTEMMTIEANISQLGKPSVRKVIEKKLGKWLLLITEPKTGSKMINFSIIANTTSGESVSPVILPITINKRLFDEEQQKERVEKAKKKAEEDKIKAAEKEEEEDEMEEEKDSDKNEGEEGVKEQEEPINWVKTSIIVLLVNIVFIAAGFFGYKFIKKGAATKQEQLLSRLD